MADSVLLKISKGIWITSGILFSVILIWLAFYNCPQSDDFFYGMWMQQWGFADANITIYYAWGGRYFSNIILTLCNGLGYSTDYKEFLLPYQLHSVFHIILFLLSTAIIFLRTNSKNALWTCIIPLVFFIKDADCLSEFFYWLAGSATYCSGYIFGAIALASAIDFHNGIAGNKRMWPGRTEIIFFSVLSSLMVMITIVFGVKPIISFLNSQPLVFLTFFWIIIGILFVLMLRPKENSLTVSFLCMLFGSFASAGSSELAGALLIVCFSMLWLWFFHKKNVQNPVYNLPILIAIAALALNVLAPATANREGTVNPQILFNFTHSLTIAFQIFSKVLESIPVIFTGAVLAISFGNQLISSQIKIQKQILFFILFLFVANFLLPFATLLKAGELPARAVNLHQLVIYVASFIFGWEAGNYLNCFPFFQSARGRLIRLSLITPAFLLFPVKTNNLFESFTDLTSGRAKVFYEDFCHEQEQIQHCNSSVCEVAPLRSKPRIISSGSNAVVSETDPQSWIQYKDNSYAAFYNKKRIFRRESITTR
jgi:hypothetical protein